MTIICVMRVTKIILKSIIGDDLLVYTKRGHLLAQTKRIFPVLDFDVCVLVSKAGVMFSGLLSVLLRKNIHVQFNLFGNSALQKCIF